MKRILIAVCSLLLVTSCSHKITGHDDAYSSGANRALMNEFDQEKENQQKSKVGDRVFFELNSSSLTAEAKLMLEHQAEFMKAHPALEFIIEGHCDERGTREYNIALGERRANAVAKYLASLGVSEDRLSVISYGKERPAVAGVDEDAWRQNRRAVTVLQ